MDADEAIKKREQKQKEKTLPFKKQEFVKGGKKVKEPVADTSSVRIYRLLTTFRTLMIANLMMLPLRRPLPKTLDRREVEPVQTPALPRRPKSKLRKT